MKARHLISVGAVALFTIACGYSIKTSTDYDRNVRFSNYHSYFIVPGNSSGNPLMDQRARADVENALASKGWTEVPEAQGQAAVVVHAATTTIPVVFVTITDPVSGGFVESLARPGGNATGFSLLEYGMSGKWLELLKEVAPRVTRAAVLRDPANPSGTEQLGAIMAVAPPLGVELTPVGVREAGEIERAITAFTRFSNGGLIITSSILTEVHRDLLITLAARHKLPAVYYRRLFVAGGGLISYGPDIVDQFRRAAGYVDRILKGEKPAHLPVQAPTKYELAINLKTAKALGLNVRPTLLARADEVIE